MKSYLEDVVTVDDAVEDVEDRVDADGERGGAVAGTELREADQRTEHDRRLVERLQPTTYNSDGNKAPSHTS